MSTSPPISVPIYIFKPYDRYIPFNHGLPPFKVVEGVLRLSAKYMARAPRDQLIHLISMAYHMNSHAEAVRDGEEIFGPDIPHPNRVLNLFRECELAEFLP